MSNLIDISKPPRYRLLMKVMNWAAPGTIFRLVDGPLRWGVALGYTKKVLPGRGLGYVVKGSAGAGRTGENTGSFAGRSGGAGKFKGGADVTAVAYGVTWIFVTGTDQVTVALLGSGKRRNCVLSDKGDVRLRM
jgi:hypothetical protein